MYEITYNDVVRLLPQNTSTRQWYENMLELFPKYDVTTPHRVAAFFAQCGHESAQFSVVKENLNYRATTLRKVFPKYFPTDALAQQYANSPNKQQAIANRVYANRMGNGPESSGDGYRYCGRGLIQLTGKNNYLRFSEAMGISLEEAVAYLETYRGALESACWFWATNGCNQLADAEDFLSLTKRINGGTIGLDDRIHHYERAKAILGVA